MGRLYEVHNSYVVEADPQARIYEVHISYIVDDGSSGGGGDPEGGVGLDAVRFQQGLVFPEGLHRSQGLVGFTQGQARGAASESNGS